MKAHHLREVADEFRNAKDHVGAIAVLIARAIDFEPHAEGVRVGNFILRDEPGTERPEGVAAFSLVPGAAALELEFPLGYVMNDAVARDMRQGLRLRDVPAMPADHDAELHFPVGLVRTPGDLDVVVRTDDGAGPF